MKKMTLKSDSISKSFNRKMIVRNVSFVLHDNESLAITGKNGSGKSTLIKILCGILTPTKGVVELAVDGTVVPADEMYRHIGLVSPYLNVYEELTGEENLHFISRIRGIEYREEFAHQLLSDFSILHHRKKEVKNYSSGMKQRLKYCAALMHAPKILFIDEPRSNLDEQGIEAVRKIMKEQIGKGALLFATNDADDLSLAQSVLNIDRLDEEK